MADPRTVFPDNIYYTLATTNNTDRADTLRFVNTGGADIVPNPIMYYLLVQKFVISSKAFPIFQFDNKLIGF